MCFVVSLRSCVCGSVCFKMGIYELDFFVLVSYLIFVGTLVFEFLSSILVQIFTTPGHLIQDTFIRCPEAHTNWDHVYYSHRGSL